MTRLPFDPVYDELPAVLPVFPLPGVLLLPGGRLPLNIFEPRYLNMVRDALAGPRMIGMIQPSEEAADVGGAPLYRTGCAGRIVAFSETEDGRYLITLAGLIRFEVARELDPRGGYRRVEPDFVPYRGDLEGDPGGIDRARLFEALRGYLEVAGIEGDWGAIEDTEDEVLVASLAMACPFEPREKQALLEARTLPERAETMTALLRMAAHERGAETLHH
ncbi:MAG: LON peptidase substrate-binding domain-containing protein [Kiloniellales bacterium]